MWNPVSFFRQYRRFIAVSSRRCLPHLLVALTVLLAATWALRADAAEPGIPLPGAPAPRLARLFTPAHLSNAAYEVMVLKEGIADAVRRVRDALPPEFRLGAPSDAWQARALDPLEAFGTAGPYDRPRLAQLYWGRPVLVARGPVERDGRVVGALTLLSPYPDPALSRLEPGTLAILLRTGR